MREFEDVRRQIDALDDRLIELLIERARLAQRIGELKDQHNAGAFAPARESEVLRRVMDKAAPPISPAALSAIYAEVISACRAAETPHRVAYMGPPYSHTHLAALRRFGSQLQFEPYGSVTETFHAVSKGLADFGIVPVENSTRGVEAEALDALARTDLQICGEFYLEIHHCLLSHSPLGEVETVYSHPQALAQCDAWLRRHLPHAGRIEVASTTAGAEQAAREPRAAAIAAKTAAAAYDLEVAAENIEDLAQNRTRFLVIGDLECPPTGRDKTSILMAARHEAGSLYNALGPLKENAINMTFIESRPTRLTPWEYHFFIDFQGHQAEDRVARALAALRERCLFVKVLGSYPAAD